MSKKLYVVELSADERKRLEELIRKGKSPAKKQLKARIVLRADESHFDPQKSVLEALKELGCAEVLAAIPAALQAIRDTIEASYSRDKLKAAHDRRDWPGVNPS